MAEHEYFGNNTGRRLLEKLKTALVGKANQSEVERLSKEIADKVSGDDLNTAVGNALEEAKTSGEFDGDDGLAVYAYNNNLSDYTGVEPPEGNYDGVFIVSLGTRTLQVGDLLIDLVGNVYRVTVVYPGTDSFDAVYVTNIHGADGEQGVSGKDGLAIYAYNGDLSVSPIASSPESAYPTENIISLGNRTLQKGDLLVDLAGNVCRVTVSYGADGFEIAYVTNIHGADYVLTGADKSEIAGMVKNLFSGETWTFTLADGSEVTKKVALL